MNIGELKHLLTLIEKLPDDGEVAFKMGHNYGTISVVIKWDGAGGPTQMKITIPHKHRQG